MIPIGRGQRELIIGDRGTGKTAVALDTIINQKGQDVQCFYVAIGQKQSTVASAWWNKPAQKSRRLRVHDGRRRPAPPNRRRCSSSPRTPASPWPSTYRENGKHALIVYDDLVQAGRGLPPDVAACLRRPPGREAYPRRRFLPPQPPARARRQDERRPTAAAASPRCPSSRPRPAMSRRTSRPTSFRSPTVRFSSRATCSYSGIRPAVNVRLSR